MDERPLPVAHERLTLREAGEILGKTKKAMEQAASRDAFPLAKKPLPSGRHRIYTTRAWLEESEYGRQALREQGIELAQPAATEYVGGLPVRRAAERNAMPSELRLKLSALRSPQERLIEQLIRENAELRLRVVELETQLELTRLEREPSP